MDLSILTFFLVLGSLSEAANKERVLRSTHVSGDSDHRRVDHDLREARNSNLANAEDELKAWPYPNIFGSPLPQESDVLPQIQNSLTGLHSGQDKIVSLIGSVLSTLQRIQQEQWNLRNLFETHSHSSQQTQIPSPISLNTLTSTPKENEESTASPAETTPVSPNGVVGESAIDKPPGLGQFLSSYAGGGNGTTGSGQWGAVTGGQQNGNGAWWTSVSNGPNAATLTSGSGVGTYSGPQNGVAPVTGGLLGNVIVPNSGAVNSQGVGTGAGGTYSVGSSSGNVPWAHWETVGGGTQGGNGSWWTTVSNGPNGGTTILSGSGYGINPKSQNVVATNIGQSSVGNGSSPKSSIAKDGGDGGGTAVGGGESKISGPSEVSEMSPGAALASGTAP